MKENSFRHEERRYLFGLGRGPRAGGGSSHSVTRKTFQAFEKESIERNAALDARAFVACRDLAAQMQRWKAPAVSADEAASRRTEEASRVKGRNAPGCQAIRNPSAK